jgi:hypothetical protein
MSAAQERVSKAINAIRQIQLSETRCVPAGGLPSTGCKDDMVGGISVEVDHLRREITINMLAPASNLVRE